MKRQYPPPPFDIVGPTGQRVTITAHSARDTVGDLSCALGLSRQESLTIDGQPVANHQPLVGSGIRAASKVTAMGHGGIPTDQMPAECDATARVEVIVTGGPDCNVAVPLPPGRHLIGRAATASVCIADPLIELHHGVLEVLPDRSVTFAQLTGRVPARIDGSPCTGTVSVPLLSELRIGSTSLRVRELNLGASSLGGNEEGSVSAITIDPWRRVVHRGPNSPAPPDEEQLVVPDPPQQHPAPPATGLVGAGIAVIGAGVVALLLGQMMFALFAMIGAVASVGTWAVGSVGAFRRRRRARAASADADAAFVANLRTARDRALARHCVEHPFPEESLQVAGALADAGTIRSSVWQCRVAEGSGVLSAVLGRGTQRWHQRLEMPSERDLPHDLALAIEQASMLSDVAVPLIFAPDTAVAFRGASDQVFGLVRSLVVQLATRCGPADWRIVVVTRTPAVWRWVGWLAHARTRGGEQLVIDAADGEGLARLLDEVQQAPDRQILLIADDPAMFATRTGALRRFIDTAGPSTIAIVDTGATVPAMCQRVLTIGSTGGAVWSGHLDHRDTAIDIRVSGVSIETAETVTRRLAALVDPEDGRDSGSALPSALSLTDIDDVTLGAFGDRDAERRAATSAIVRRWNAAGHDPSPRAPIGRSVDGAVELDLVRDGPHGLIAGTTGSGKSELLRTMVVSLASQLSPDHLTFVLVDYKGGATFDACARLPHTVGVVTDLDAGLAERALVSLEAELHRREELLRLVGASDLSDYRSHRESEVMPRLVVVIDEFAALAKELPDFLTALVGIAQRGRSLGIHLILATQRPAGVVTDDIRANTNLRIALRLNDVADAHDVVGNVQPAEFGRGSPGRAALRLGPDELVVFQAARCTGPATVQSGRLRAKESATSDTTGNPGDGDQGSALPTSELEVAVALIANAATLAEIAVPHRPWIESLPAMLCHEVVADIAQRAVGGDMRDAIGIVDEPTAQSQVPLRWDHRGGHLALIGSLGSGTTSTLIAVLAARCRAASPERLHCYVIDARGDPALDGLAGIAHCGGVLRVQELERLHRVLARLVAEIDNRVSGIGQDDWVDVVLAIDGLASLRTALSSIDMAPSLALLDRILADGPAAGVVCCWTADGTSANSASMSAAESWVFHLDDPALARSLAGGSVAIPADLPGRLRIASTGLDAQVAVGAAGVAELPDRSTGRGPAAVEILPKNLSCEVLADAASALAAIAGPAPIAASAGVELPIGLVADDLAVAALHLPQLDHIFIGGAALTGKSTALAQVANAWRQANPSGTTVVVDRRRPLTTDRLTERPGAPVLVLVDDAERVDDEGGLLAEILASGDPNITVAAAARLDAVRSSYGHWARDVARSRCGVILTSAGDVDGDLLGVTLPRRSLIAPRPGLGWLIDSRGQRLIQIAS